MDQLTDPDEDLLRKARVSPEGDLHAFEQLVRKYQAKVVANCRHLTRDAGSAEDLAQEVFVKAYFGLRKFEGRSAFRTWLQRIKVNHCLNHIKKHSGRAFVSVEDEGVACADELIQKTTGESDALAATERERIAGILDSISDNLRIPLIMRDMDQLSYEEVAEALGIGLSAVKMRIKRGREDFRRRYRESADPQARLAE